MDELAMYPSPPWLSLGTFGGGVVVEGSLQALVAAGIVTASEPLPRAPRGSIRRYYGRQYLRITMRENGRLCVYGRHLEAARADAGFQRFLQRAFGQ